MASVVGCGSVKDSVRQISYSPVEPSYQCSSSSSSSISAKIFSSCVIDWNKHNCRDEESRKCTDYHSQNSSDLSSKLDKAVQRNDYHRVLYLIEKKKATATARTLEYAAETRNIFLIKKLIENKAPVTAKALEIASQDKNRNFHIVRYLLEKGAPITPKALEIASQNGNYAIPICLMDNGASPTVETLENATLKGSFYTVKHLIKNMRIRPTAKILVYAVQSGSICKVEYLVKKGAPITIEAFENAEKNNDTDMFECFKKKDPKAFEAFIKSKRASIKSNCCTSSCKKITMCCLGIMVVFVTVVTGYFARRN